jgi:hypothetical protein
MTFKPYVIWNKANPRYLCKSENLSKREGKFRCNKKWKLYEN